MISLPELHLDALTEVFNVGAGRAASSLSEIVGEEVKLSVPLIQLLKSSEINAEVLSLPGSRLGAVSQDFSGPFSANAMLLFTEERALEIVRDMMGSQLSTEGLAEFEQEAMCELGNIILDSTLPVYAVNSSAAILQEIVANPNQPVMMALHIDLAIERRHSEGVLVFLLSSSSLQELMTHIDRFVSGV